MPRAEEIAAQARDLIRVDYEDLPVVTDPADGDARTAQPCCTRTGTRTCSAITASAKGMWMPALPQADVIVEGEYRTPAQEHAYLQPEAGLGYIDEEGRVTVMVGWAVDARRPGADRPCSGPAAGAGAGHLPGDRRRIWRA